MIEIICKESIEEVLEYPQDYVDASQDVALLRVFGKDVSNPTYMLIGVDEDDERYYLVVEDNDTSVDHYLEDGQTLQGLFEKLLNEIVEED